MGWYFSSQSRSALIAQLIAPQETERASVKVVARAARQCPLVRIGSDRQGRRRASRPRAGPVPAQHPLRSAGAQRRPMGSQALGRMHAPYYYSCPLSYLDLAPEQSADWRAGVRAYHARRRTPTVATASAAAPTA